MGEQTQGRRRPLAIVIVGLLGLAGLIWMLWPKPRLVEHGEVSEAGSSWRVEQGRAVLTGPTMGTSFSVVVSGEDFDLGELAELQRGIDAELAAVNAEMSTYLADSELSRFNRSPADVGFEASAHLLEIVALAKQVSERSGGAFDVTVGPLVDAWGFGPGDPAERRELDDAEIARLRSVVGDEKLEVDLAAGRLRKRVAGLRVDLSAIAKGHGSDRVAAVLEAAGERDYMVEIGGEVRVSGSNPRGEPWKIGVERPTGDASGSRAVQTILRVRDVGVATSGDYRNYWERDGVRYSHTIDPRTGRPITHALASVTVIHPESAALADAWATALNVLGPEQGLALAEQLELAAYFLVRTDEGFEARSTPAFAAYLPN
jgi:FAD:protein FMN transferase